MHVRVDNVIGAKFAMVSAPSIGTRQLPVTTGRVFKLPLVVRDSILRTISASGQNGPAKEDAEVVVPEDERPGQEF